MKQSLFQYVLLWHPTTDESKEGKKSKILKDLTMVLAQDQKTAAILAARSIPDEYVEALDQVEVIIRPF